ncbi:sushi, von Willebrand factor type A, EGF and pentraxin domain-containing protein 1-like [Dreissena polymorpha]|uniref:sushi, von Willebrand factor type A, EGF and pentraxin domain-containing protein 1-like n=1 Tax=Dreissena polymorpha TaxID=45954 RepID=UPI002263ECC2|nr:sushi, von Willebrand factor type A, EGF and pentraxin domain-containing protein 1-like [Dreissena polymorpha]
MIVRSCLALLVIAQNALIADGCSSQIQSCTNCYVSEKKCSKDEVSGKNKTSCMSVIDNDSMVQIVSWVHHDNKCFKFNNCEGNTGHLVYAANDVSRRRVCHTDCLSVEFKMEANRYGQVSAHNNSVVYDGLGNDEECFAHCIGHTSCVSSFNSNNNKTCWIHNSCDPCTTIYAVDYTTYTWICLDNVQSGCPALQNILHGYVNSSGLNNGDTASYTCELGYTLSSSSTRFCTSNRTWNSSEPSCDLITCASPLAPVNGALHLNGSSFGGRAIYSCNVGHFLSSSNTATCNASGQWDTPAPICILHNCGNLSKPQNGLVNFAATTYGAIAYYVCDVGYNLNGSKSSTCNGTGDWDREPPTCTPIDCGPMLNPSNGHVSYFSTTYGSIANYSCNLGYFMYGSNSTTCMAEGHWLTTNPDCAQL